MNTAMYMVFFSSQNYPRGLWPQVIINDVVSLVKQSGPWNIFNEQMIYYSWLQSLVANGSLSQGDLPPQPLPINFN